MQSELRLQALKGGYEHSYILLEFGETKLNFFSAKKKNISCKNSDKAAAAVMARS